MMDLLQWFFSSHFSSKIFLEVCLDASWTLRVVQSILFWSLKALFVQGFWSKRVADTEEDKDSLRLTRRVSRAAREVFSELFRHQDLLVLVFIGEKQQWNRMMFAMIWRYYMIIRDTLRCNVMKFEIWCDVMLWDWKLFDMMSEVYLCVWSWQTTNIPVLTTTVLWQGHLVFWHNFGCRTHTEPGGSLCKICVCHRPQIFFVGFFCWKWFGSFRGLVVSPVEL